MRQKTQAASFVDAATILVGAVACGLEIGGIILSSSKLIISGALGMPMVGFLAFMASRMVLHRSPDQQKNSPEGHDSGLTPTGPAGK